MEEVEIWVVRDKDSSLWMFFKKPDKDTDEGVWSVSGPYYPVVRLSEDNFPSVKWENENPTKAKIILEL